MDIKTRINELSAAYFEETVGMRRELHRQPELSMKEEKTAAYICKKLSEYGISYKTFEKHHGVLGIIEGKNPNKKVIALRADMDALPILEKNKTDYNSQNTGVMHACGHDVHMASLLSVARILNDLRTCFSGTVKLIFQPSEEQYPGGAIMMINDGILENPEVDVVIGQHVIPTIESGKIGIKNGMSMASTDEIYIDILGKGGHAATPDLNTDPVVIAAQVVSSLQQVVSRKAPPHIPTVLSFGRFIADGKVNIIPDTVQLEGTIRTFDENWRSEAHNHIRTMVKSIANAFGADATVRIEKGYPYLINDDTLTERCRKTAKEVLGNENVIEMDVRMTAEDFAYFSHKKPACFYRLGISNKEKGINSNLHTATFDIDENALLTSVTLMAHIAISELD